MQTKFCPTTGCVDISGSDGRWIVMSQHAELTGEIRNGLPVVKSTGKVTYDEGDAARFDWNGNTQEFEPSIDCILQED